MALDGPPAAVAPNATAEHEAAGGDFDAALSAAMADDTEQGLSTETETAQDVNAPKPEAGKTADAAETEEVADVAAEAKPVEKPPEPKQEEDSEAKKLRAGFTALARDRGKLREREAAAIAKEQAAQVYSQKAQAYDQLIRQMEADPVAIFKAHPRADELINKLLDGIVASEKSPAEREVAKLREEVARDKANLEAQKTAQLVENWKQTIRADVTKEADKFDLVNSLGQHEAVIQTITDYYTQYNGAILDVATAAQAIEDLLEAGVKKSKKFGSRAPVPSAQPVPGKTAPASRKAGSVTLASVHSSELPSGDGDDLPLDDPNERFRRVMAGLG